MAPISAATTMRLEARARTNARKRWGASTKELEDAIGRGLCTSERSMTGFIAIDTRVNAGFGKA